MADVIDLVSSDSDEEMAEEGKKKQRQPARYWCITVYPEDNDTEDHPGHEWMADRHDLWPTATAHTKLRYVVAGMETCPDTGRRHIQMYLETPSLVKFRLKGLKRYLRCNDLHAEERRGSRPQAADYCKKEGDYIEHGIWVKGQGERTDLAEVCNMVQEGWSERKIAEEAPKVYVQFTRGIRSLMNVLTKMEDRPTPKVYVLYGDSGTGKSYTLRKKARAKEAEGVYWKPDGEWWDGYTEQKVVMFDDFEGTDSELKFRTLLKVLSEVPMYVPVKGAMVLLKASEFWFSSNRSPKEWYPPADTPYNKHQLARRLTSVVRLLKKDTSPVETTYPVERTFEVDAEYNREEMKE